MKSRLSFLVLLLAVPLTAQTTPPSTTPAAAINDSIVVTASALPETIETTPATVTIVTRQQIEQREARDVADVLREVPGLTISRSGSPGKATSLFTRGSNSTHTLVLWNGVEINNPYFAGYDWGRFSTAGVEQIEVVRGPYSALYGSEAVAGVVNILTAPRSSGLWGDVSLGGHGLRNGRLDGSYAGSSLSASGSFERRDDDGWFRNDDFKQNAGTFQLKWSGPAHLSIGAQGRYTDYELGVPFNLNGPGSALIPSLLRRQTGNERQLAIPIAQTFGRLSYDLTLSESKRDDDFVDPEDPYGYTSGKTSSTTRRARLAVNAKTGIGTFVVGGEYERAVVDDLTVFGPNLLDAKRNNRSLFAEDRMSRTLSPTSRLEISLGVRYDHFDTFGSQTSPRIAGALVYGREKIRVAYGEGFRAPSIGELYFPFSGNAALNAEHSRNLEAGYDRSLGSNGLFSLTLFRSRYKDLIVFDNRTYTFQNAGNAKSQGLELGLQGDVTQALSTGISYTWLETKDDSGLSLARRPRHSGSVFAGYRVGSVDTNVTITHSGSRADVLPVFPFNRINDAAYTTADINVQMHLGRLIPYVKLENATGAKFEEVRGYPAPGRRAVVGLRFEVK
jgi:vitamin B12 transporter